MKNKNLKNYDNRVVIKPGEKNIIFLEIKKNCNYLSQNE